jgi:hypothetical protein
MFGGVRGRVRAWLTAGAGTIAAILIAGLFGAFGALPNPPVPEFPTDSPIEAGQWTILPVRAYVSEQRVYELPLNQDQKALVVEVDMTNRTAESTKDYFTVFELAAPLRDQAEKPFIALARDSKMSPELHPAMTERMAYVWPVPKTAALPNRLSLVINARIYKPRDNLYGTPGWFNQHEAGRITLPVGASDGTVEASQ